MQNEVEVLAIIDIIGRSAYAVTTLSLLIRETERYISLSIDQPSIKELNVSWCIYKLKRSV